MENELLWTAKLVVGRTFEEIVEFSNKEKLSGRANWETAEIKDAVGRHLVKVVLKDDVVWEAVKSGLASLVSVQDEMRIMISRQRSRLDRMIAVETARAAANAVMGGNSYNKFIRYELTLLKDLLLIYNETYGPDAKVDSKGMDDNARTEIIRAMGRYEATKNDGRGVPTPA